MSDDRKPAKAAHLVDGPCDPFFTNGFPDPHAKKVDPFILRESVFEPRDDLDAVPGMGIAIANDLQNGLVVHEIGVVRHTDEFESVLQAKADQFLQG
jgi:hypothetical protein